MKIQYSKFEHIADIATIQHPKELFEHTLKLRNLRNQLSILTKTRKTLQPIFTSFTLETAQCLEQRTRIK